ncbi:MAG TPA: 4Fe-4S double cluster binding domain-containing protein, partial [Candidatus Krumholzibacterium sp.]|nr:4Fe-4S double cluster binding domain-containing protein [Candidatus Krumholzibacterium sp.]
LRTALAAACVVSMRGSAAAVLATGDEKRFKYDYRMLPVSRLPQMKEDIDRLVREKRVSDNETYRSYIEGRDYGMPEDFPGARTIISLATACPMGLVDFHYRGEKHELVIAPQYFDDGIAAEDLDRVVKEEIIGEGDWRVERIHGPLQKNLAVRSGLGRYGRNNIVYVDGMGSFLTLYCYFTDFDPGRDDWGELRMLDECGSCRICRRTCPTGAIRDDEFVIDAGRCLTLYNEVDGEFPEWIAPGSHNALAGCMKCQSPCPANREAKKNTLRLEPVTEEETEKILAGTSDTKLLETLTGKLKSYYPARSQEYFPIFTRNLGVLLRPEG